MYTLLLVNGRVGAVGRFIQQSLNSPLFYLISTCTEGHL